MKILFIIQDFIIEPLGLMYLSGSLRKKGHEVKVIKVNLSGYDLNALSAEQVHRKEVVRNRDLIKKVKEFFPDLLGYSVTTGMHVHYLKLNRELKKDLKVLSIFGGPHPTFFPEIIEEEGVDFICRGEGEEAIEEIAEKLENGDDYNHVRNLWIKGEKEIIKNEIRPLKNDLDSISPDRELFYELFPSLKFSPIKNFMASRGCPYDCSYCFNHIYRKIYGNNGLKVRYRSPSNVTEEIKSVKDNYPLEIVYFQDDTFNLNRNWLGDLLKLYRKGIGLPFHAHLRPDLIDEELIRMLASSNCLSVTLAFETADDTIRNKLLKRGMSKKEMLLAARLLHKYGIKFRIENILGLPTGDIQCDWQTLDLNIKARPSIAWASLYQPYPRTVLGEFCKSKKLIDSLDLNSIRPSFFQSSILNLKHKTRVENLQKLFSITVEWPFLRPLVRQVIKLSPHKFFNWVYVQWKRYAYQRRLYYLSPYRKRCFKPRLLFIALGGLGNVLMNTPAFRELKEKFPRAYLTVAVLKGRGGKEVLENNPFVDEIFVYDPRWFKGLNMFKFWQWMRRHRFDVTLAMYPMGRNIFTVFSYLFRVPWRIKHLSIRNDKVDNFLHNVLISLPPAYHHCDYNRQLVCALDEVIHTRTQRKRTYLDVRVSPSKLSLELYLTEKDRAFKEFFFSRFGLAEGELLFGLHPGCRPETSQKRWPGECFAVLADKLYQRYRGRIIIFGTPQEEDELKMIIGASQVPIIKAANFTLREVTVLIAACHLLIANDSGLMHLSQAVGTPVIALFGPSNPFKVGPVNHNSIVLKTAHTLSCPGIKESEMCCYFLHENRCPYKKGGIAECFYYLTVDEVMEAVNKILTPKNR